MTLSQRKIFAKVTKKCHEEWWTMFFQVFGKILRRRTSESWVLELVNYLNRHWGKNVRFSTIIQIFVTTTCFPCSFWWTKCDLEKSHLEKPFFLEITFPTCFSFSRETFPLFYLRLPPHLTCLSRLRLSKCLFNIVVDLQSSGFVCMWVGRWQTPSILRFFRENSGESLLRKEECMAMAITVPAWTQRSESNRLMMRSFVVALRLYLWNGERNEENKAILAWK